MSDKDQDDHALLITHVGILNEQLSVIQREIALINKRLSKLNVSLPSTVDKTVTNEPIIVLYDLETTGLGKSSEICITEIGARQLDTKGKKLRSFRCLVNPLVPVSESASKITGHTTQKLSTYNKWSRVGKQFNDWLNSLRENEEQCIYICAHNGKRYDSRLLVFEHTRHGLEFPRNLFSVDTLPLFKQMYPKLQSYSLSKLYKDVFGEQIRDCHTAIGDISAMNELFEVGVMHGPEIIYRWIKEHSESFDTVQKRCFKAK